MFGSFTCHRCDGSFRTIRAYRQHKCPARLAAARTVYDRANTRHIRTLEADYQRTGRRERVLMV